MTARTRQNVRLRRTALAFVALLALSACGGSDGGDKDDAESSGSEAPTATSDTSDGGDVETETSSSNGGDGGDSGDETPVATDAGSAPQIETPEPELDAEPQTGGTLRYVIEADVDGLNPAGSKLSSPGLTMSNAVFDSLTARIPEGGWVPYLAESFEPSPEYKSWTMKLRPNITFHDGETLNADAIIANFEAQYAHPVVGLAVKPFFPETGAIEKIDDLTVKYNLLDADANFPGRLYTQLGRVASPKWLAATAEDASLNQMPVGTGPFVFDSRSQDSVTRFVRNENYWNGEVHLDAVEFLPVPDTAARNDLLLGGEADMLQTTDGAAIAALKEEESITNVLSDASEEQFVMMNTAVPPFNDLRARQALANATSRENFIQLIGAGIKRAADQRFIPESPYYNPDVKQVADDPETAVKLAGEYCAEKGDEINPITEQPTCTDGKINIEFQWTTGSTIQDRAAELLAEDYKVAFNIIMDPLLQKGQITQAAIGQYNSIYWRQFGAENPSEDNVWLLCRTIDPAGISLNWPRYCDEERDAALLAATASTDEAERVELYKQAEELINEAYTYIFLYHELWDNAYTSKVHGVCDHMSPEGELLACSSNGETWFSSVWLEQ